MIFNEVYGNYYNAVAKILSEAVDGNLDRAKITKIAEREAFGESIVTIPDSLISGKWPLINSDFETPVKNKPTMPLSDIQRMWLKGILLDPRIQLFEPAMDGLEDVEPLFDNDTFVYFDRYLDGDPYEDINYRKCFRHALLGVKQKHKLLIKFEGKSGVQTRLIIPEKLEYSIKDDKFRLLGVSAKKVPYVINMATIISCDLAEQFSEAEQRYHSKKETVVLSLTDRRNALERVMLHFSDLEKETIKIDDLNYQVKLYYQKNDETEVLIRILAFGPMLKVLKPQRFVELIKERILNQKSCEF